MSEVLNLSELKEKIANFAKERDWEQFHTPKNLSMALNVESGELLEIFQWLTQEESYKVVNDEKAMNKIRDELADITVYLVRMAAILNVDLNSAIKHKMEKNAKKYPPEKARGNARKYDEL